MPTGYTSKLVNDGQTFTEFALTCARAFGGFIHMRDDSMDAPLRLDTPSVYHQKGFEESTAKVANLLAMSEDQQLAYGESEKADSIARYEKMLAENVAENARINDMLAQVRAWTHPTDGHQVMKDFMIQQLETSLNTANYVEKALEQAKESDASDIWSKALDCARDSVERHEKGIQEDHDRTDTRNEWCVALFKSLGLDVPT